MTNCNLCFFFSDDKKKKTAEKLVEKTDQAKVKAKQTEDAYKQAIEKANEARKKYISEQMPATLEAFQKLHQERLAIRLESLKKQICCFNTAAHVAGNKRSLF